MVIQYRGHGLVALSLLIGYTAQCIWKSISGSIIRYSSFCSLLHLFIYSSSVANVQLTADLAVIFPKYSLFKFTFYQFQEFLFSHEPVEKILQSSLISYFREKFLMIRTPDDRILRVVI